MGCRAVPFLHIYLTRVSSTFIAWVTLFDCEALQDEEVIQAFSRVGAPAASSPAQGSAAPARGATGVTAVRVVRDGKTNVGKGFAFVEFATPTAARMALALNGTEVCV